MEGSTGSGRLKNMAAYARYIDAGIAELEKTLASPESLMPDENYSEHAREFMETVLKDIQEIEQHSQEVKEALTAQLEETRREVRKAEEANKRIAEGLSEIENTLKPYGYDSSKMPQIDSNVSTNEQVSDELDSVAEQDEQQAFQNSVMSADCSNSPDLNISITPIFTSRSNSKSIISTPCSSATPLSARLKNQLQSRFLNKENSGSPFTIKNEPKSVSVEKPPRVFVKPPRPILSEFTYQLLGENPPPEFYDRQECQD